MDLPLIGFYVGLVIIVVGIFGLSISKGGVLWWIPCAVGFVLAVISAKVVLTREHPPEHIEVYHSPAKAP